MKATNDCDAKLDIWAKESKVHPLPHLTGIPRFGAKKFDSHEAFNAWKRRLMDEIARRGGVRWTR